MAYSDQIKSGITETDLRRYLSDGNQTSVTFRIPSNLHDAAKESAGLQGLSFSGYLRKLMIDDLVERR